MDAFTGLSAILCETQAFTKDIPYQCGTGPLKLGDRGCAVGKICYEVCAARQVRQIFFKVLLQGKN